jgi:CBS-domain-containing membrane protein
MKSAQSSLLMVRTGLGIVEAFTVDYLDSLWLALIGWFIIIIIIAEGKAATARTALAGLRVADVMTPHPELASGWHSVAEFTDQAARSRQDTFPVVGFSGELTGIVLTSQLARIPARERPGVRLDKVAPPVPPGYRAAPGDPAAPLATRSPLGGEVAAVVLTDGQVTGTVTVSDLQQAQRRRTLITGQ